MSNKELKQIANEVLEQMQSNPYYIDLYEHSLKNIRDTILEINQPNIGNTFYNENGTLGSESTSGFEDNTVNNNFTNNSMNFDFLDIIPPQIKQRSTPHPAPMIPPVQPSMPSGMQRPIPPIFGQTLVPSGLGDNVDSLLAQANQVPFLYHNQQL
ncbi:hypothetical protein M9Y10_014679 [Tritrichomonas musculus]|uniref:Uncharacterized protein n=1 Tax=Tritrichomonas musculus TaxID=1915356 RepID=A0ABR2L213_9EUKA